MTWSIVARHPSGAFGVAVASKFFAVGALCPAVTNGKGALSTQALVNPLYDAAGRSAAHTGSSCIEWCGHITRDGFSVAGNMLAGPRVIEETARVFVSSVSLPFAEQLMTAMEAGEAAGGDKRGKQGAALLIHTSEDYPFLDLRVDDHVDPLAELRRLYSVSLERFQPFMGCLPSRAQPAGITDRAVIEERIAQFHAVRAKA